MKTTYLITGLLLCNLALHAQKTTVTAAIAGLKDVQVTIHYYAGKTSKADTVKVTGGQFKWTANMPEPQKVYIMFAQRYFQFFAESGKINITGTADSLHVLNVTGSKTQEESEAHNASIKDITDQESALYQKYGKVSKEEQGALEQKLD